MAKLKNLFFNECTSCKFVNGTVRFYCKCGSNVQGTSKAIKAHIEKDSHKTGMPSTNSIRNHFHPTSEAVCKVERERQLVAISAECDISIETLLYFLTQTNVVSLLQGLHSNSFSCASTFRTRLREVFAERRAELRKNLISENDEQVFISLSIDETSRYNNHAYVGILAKTYRGTFLVDVVDAEEENAALTAEGYGNILRKFLNLPPQPILSTSNPPSLPNPPNLANPAGRPDPVIFPPIPETNVLQVMSDNPLWSLPFRLCAEWMIVFRSELPLKLYLPSSSCILIKELNEVFF